MLYNTTLSGWSSGSTVSVSGQPFSQALQTSVRDTTWYSQPVIGGTQVLCQGYLNAAGLTGHPSDENGWTAAIGISFVNSDGTSVWDAAAAIPSGQGWTFVSGTVTAPPLAVSMRPWVQIGAFPSDNTYYIQCAKFSFSTSFNGWNLITMPSTPVARQIDFTANDSVGYSQSPFTLQAQTIYWPGADWWEANVSLPAMKSGTTLNKWIGWMLALRGKANVFQLGDPLGAIPQGHPQGTPVIDGVHLAMATSINTRGWTPNVGMLLMPGDYIQIGYRLHRVAGVTPVNSDANGKATIEIWPSLREAPPDGQALVLANTTGLFRLADNKREWTVRETRSTGLSFKAIEAR